MFPGVVQADILKQMVIQQQGCHPRTSGLFK